MQTLHKTNAIPLACSSDTFSLSQKYARVELMPGINVVYMETMTGELRLSAKAQNMF
jgi:hypothetical protein